MGAPLIVDGRVVGVLTLDALDVAAFDRVDDESVAMLAMARSWDAAEADR